MKSSFGFMKQFTLCDADRATVEAAARSKAKDLIEKIERHVTEYRAHMLVYRGQSLPGKRAALQKVVKGTVKLRAAVGALPVFAYGVLRQRLLMEGFPNAIASDLMRALDMLLRAATDAADDYRQRRSGAPVSASTIFVKLIATAYESTTGRRATTTRDGRFDKVLQVALRAAGIPTGEDRTHLIGRALKLLPTKPHKS